MAYKKGAMSEANSCLGSLIVQLHSQAWHRQGCKQASVKLCYRIRKITILFEEVRMVLLL